MLLYNGLQLVQPKQGGNMFKLLWNILKDEQGGLFGTGLALAGGGALLGGLFGKNKRREEVYDPYAQLRGDYQTYMQGKLGQRTPYQYSPAFELDQPEVETATEQTILGRLKDLPTSGEYKEKVEASKQQQIARAEERGEQRIEEERDMYNRLGLATSTPFLARAGEIGEEISGEVADIESAMDIYGLEYGMQADKLAEDIANMWATQGGVLGGQQRGYQQYAQQMSLQDLIRQLEEEQAYASMATGLLGGSPPERTLMYEPNWASQLGSAGMDIGKLMLMGGILKG